VVEEMIMPTVPSDIFVPSVQPQGRLQPQNLDVSPAMFGGQVGQTLERGADELEQNAVQRQRMINKARAEDLFSTQYVPAMADLTNEFYSLKGQAAEDSYRDYAQRLVQLQRDYAAKLPNPPAQFIFDEYSKNWNAREIERMSRHAAEQSNAWQAKANDSMVDAHVLDGQSHYNDPQTLKRNHEQIIHGLNFFGTAKNIDQGTTDLKVADAVNRMYYGAIWNQAQSDPAAAQEMVRRYRKYLNENSAAALEAEVKSRRTGEQVSRRILAEGQNRAGEIRAGEQEIGD
jgi:hypothetical protein